MIRTATTALLVDVEADVRERVEIPLTRWWPEYWLTDKGRFDFQREVPEGGDAILGYAAVYYRNPDYGTHDGPCCPSCEDDRMEGWCDFAEEACCCRGVKRI